MKHTGLPSVPPLTQGKAGSQPLTTATLVRAATMALLMHRTRLEATTYWSPLSLAHCSCAELVAGSGVSPWLPLGRDSSIASFYPWSCLHRAAAAAWALVGLVYLSFLKAASSRDDVFSSVKPRLTASRQIMPYKRGQTALLKYSENFYSGSYTDDLDLGGEIEQTSSADKAEGFLKVAFFHFCN